MKYGFLILHYMDLQVTIDCVKNIIQRFGKNDIEIVIVDNASPNGSGEALQTLFEKNDQVKVLISSENLGFAKGNNLGFDYLKKNFDLDYMIVINNDIDIQDNKFLEKIAEEYKQSKFAVLGPDIITIHDKKHQNPAHTEAFSLVELEKLRAAYEKMNRVYPYYYLKGKAVSFIKRVMNHSNTVAHNIRGRQLNVVLHGACYILSRDFIQKREYLFFPKTFMYFEEDILHYDCGKLGLRMVYSPSLEVYHAEDVSTDATFKSQYSKEKFKLENMLKSITIFIDHIGN